MKNKRFSVNVLRMVHELSIDERSKTPLKGDQLNILLNDIRKLVIDVEKGGDGRYMTAPEGDERAIIFIDEIDKGITEDDLCVGYFIKRRAGSKPFQDDGNGHLAELNLAGSHEIAEVSPFVIDKTHGLLYWTYNPQVGGLKQYIQYINQKYFICKENGLTQLDLQVNNIPSVINFHYVGYPESVKQFEDRMQRIRSLKFNLCSTSEHLAELYLGEKSDKIDQVGMQLMREIISNSNCATIGIDLTANRKKKTDKNEQVSSLNKEYILGLYHTFTPYLLEKGNKFTVEGEMIDEDTRVLDLVHSKLIYYLNFPYESTTLPLSGLAKEMLSLVKSHREEAVRHYGNKVS